MAESDFFSHRALRCVRANLDLATAGNVQIGTIGMSPVVCLILCALAEKGGLTYEEIGQRIGLPMHVVYDSVGIIAQPVVGGRPPLVRREKPRKGLNRTTVFLTEGGRAQHAQIMRNG